MIPKTLAENAGLNAMEIISSLYERHASGNAKAGIDLEGGTCIDILGSKDPWDLYITKYASFSLGTVIGSAYYGLSSGVILA